MPLSINVGLSRKASKDFQSTGVSINVTAELDQSLLARPEELQQQIDALYQQAELALDRQVGVPQRQTHTEPERQYRQPTQQRLVQQRRSYQQPVRSNGSGNRGRYDQSDGNGHDNGNSRPNGNGMTQSQRRAITAIAHRINADPAYEARQIVGRELDSLSIREASDLIDHLKSLQPAGNGGNGNGR